MIQKNNQHIYLSDYKKILTGNPQTLTSKFQIDFSLTLKLVSINNFDMENFINKSMISESINAERKLVETTLSNLKNEYASKQIHLFTDIEIIEKYKKLSNEVV